MAYDEFLAERIDQVLKKRPINYYQKKMFGGVCFMVDDKMCIGVVKNQLMARVGAEKYDDALNLNGAEKMNFTGKPMKGYIFINPDGYDMDDDLEKWIDMALAYNPMAKSSKKK